MTIHIQSLKALADSFTTAGDGVASILTGRSGHAVGVGLPGPVATACSFGVAVASTASQTIATKLRDMSDHTQNAVSAYGGSENNSADFYDSL